MAAQPLSIEDPTIAEAYLPFQPAVTTDADLANGLQDNAFDVKKVAPDFDIVWCKEVDEHLCPYPSGERPNPTTTSDFLCQMINGVPYPFEVGGEPVTHGDPHFITLVRAANMTQRLLSTRPGAKLFSDMFMYWDEGKPVKKCAPDIYVFPQLEPHEKQILSVRVWEEVSSPVFVMELISVNTAEEDIETKFNIYQDEIKIPEYMQCDVREYPYKFIGYRLENGKYIKLEPDEQGRFWSEQLEAWFGLNQDGDFQVWEASGYPLPAYEDASAALEREIAFGREQAARAEQEAQRAQQEAQRAQQEAQRAQQEEALRHRAEARIRELEEELRRRNG